LDVHVTNQFLDQVPTLGFGFSQTNQAKYPNLGGGFRCCFIFTPKLGEMIQFDEFFKWVGSTTNQH